MGTRSYFRLSLILYLNNIIIGNDHFRYPFKHLEQNWTFEQKEVLDTAFYVTNYGNNNVFF